MNQALSPLSMDPSCPVILRLPSADNCGGVSAAAAASRESLQFSFPAVGGSDQNGAAPTCGRKAADNARQIEWPELDRPQVAGACVELAESIYWRLTPGRPSVLAITSPLDGEGKTSLVLALAHDLAERTPGDVLAVDADPRRRELTSRLGVKEPRPDERIWPTNVPSLSVVPCFARSPAGWPDAASIAGFRKQASLAILDCPSLEHAETASLLRACDGVYVVVRLGQTPRRAVVEAARIIRACGAQLLGGIAVA
ncbi:MAG: hypothetical protein ABFC96_03695 [Thermoguttaceae bacterium]